VKALVLGAPQEAVVAGGVSVIVAVAVLVGSAALACTVTFCWLVTEAGAV